MNCSKQYSTFSSLVSHHLHVEHFLFSVVTHKQLIAGQACRHHHHHHHYYYYQRIISPARQGRQSGCSVLSLLACVGLHTTARTYANVPSLRPTLVDNQCQISISFHSLSEVRLSMESARSRRLVVDCITVTSHVRVRRFTIHFSAC